MAAKISDKAVLLREAILAVLRRATEPMNNIEVYAEPEFTNLGVSGNDVSMELAHMYKLKTARYKVSRVPSNKQYSMWDYYLPDVVKLAYVPKVTKREPPEEKPPVNTVNQPEFKFDPVRFSDLEVNAPPAPPTPADEAGLAVQVAKGVKAITLSVAGVTIKIELE